MWCPGDCKTARSCSKNASAASSPTVLGKYALRYEKTKGVSDATSWRTNECHTAIGCRYALISGIGDLERLVVSRSSREQEQSAEILQQSSSLTMRRRDRGPQVRSQRADRLVKVAVQVRDAVITHSHTKLGTMDGSANEPEKDQEQRRAVESVLDRSSCVLGRDHAALCEELLRHLLSYTHAQSIEMQAIPRARHCALMNARACHRIASFRENCSELSKDHTSWTSVYTAIT